MQATIHHAVTVIMYDRHLPKQRPKVDANRRHLEAYHELALDMGYDPALIERLIHTPTEYPL